MGKMNRINYMLLMAMAGVALSSGEHSPEYSESEERKPFEPTERKPYKRPKKFTKKHR